MIGYCWFERVDNSSGAPRVTKTIWPREDYGLYLVNYDAPLPEVRTYRANIEGMDGTLDLTEWEGAGIVRYQDRTVTVRLRDLDGRGRDFTAEMLGKRFFIHFSDDLDHCYYGRCESIEEEVRNRVNDITMTFTCSPYRTLMSPLVKKIVVNASGDTSRTAYKTEIISLGTGQAVPTFTASGVQTSGQSGQQSVVYTKTEHYTGTLYTLWNTVAGGRFKGSAHYGKPRSAYVGCTGVIIFDGMDITDAEVKSITLTVKAAKVGFGQWKTKTIQLHKPASGVTFDETMKGQDYAGDSLGSMTGVFYENTTQNEITGTLLENIGAWFAAGGNTLVMYNPSETASRDDHSENNLGWTDVQMDIVYEVTEQSTETVYSTLEVESNGIRGEYKIEANGIIHTDDVLFRAGENRVTVNNRNESGALTVSVSWKPEVI